MRIPSASCARQAGLQTAGTAAGQPPGSQAQGFRPGASMAGNTVSQWVLILIVVLGGSRVVYLWNTSIENAVFRFSDDAFYYFNIARNIVHGYGVTFDRMNQTNGFHPLWMLVLAPIYAAIPTDLEAPVRIVGTLLTALAAISAWLLYRIVSEWLGTWPALFSLSLFGSPLVLNHFFNGLESGLVVFLILLLVRLEQVLSPFDPGVGRGTAFVFGCLAGLILLARLDTVFAVAATIVAWLVAGRSSYRLGHFWLGVKGPLVGSAVCGALGASYVAWVASTTGHLVPISGAVKSSFPWPGVSSSSLRSPVVLVFGLSLVTFWLLLFLKHTSRLVSQREHAHERRALPLNLLVPLYIGASLHFMYEILFVKWGLEWWHFASHVPPLLLLAGWVFHLVLRKVGRRARMVLPALAAAASIVMFFADIEVRGDHRRPWFEAVRWAQANTSTDAVFAMTDSGFFGYFSGRRTVNLDGKANSYAFQESLRNGQLSDFLRTRGVTHLADYEVPYPPREFRRIRLRSGLYDVPGGELIAGGSAEVYRSAPYVNHVQILRRKGPVSFVVWDFRAIRVTDGGRGSQAAQTLLRPAR